MPRLLRYPIVLAVVDDLFLLISDSLLSGSLSDLYVKISPHVGGVLFDAVVDIVLIGLLIPRVRAFIVGEGLHERLS